MRCILPGTAYEHMYAYYSRTTLYRYVARGLCSGENGSLMTVGSRDEVSWRDPAAVQRPSVSGHFANLLSLEVDQRWEVHLLNLQLVIAYAW